MALLSLLDPLYCQEETLELEEELTQPMPSLSDELDADGHLITAPAPAEELAEVLCSLTRKEAETRPELLPDGAEDDTYLLWARREAVEWVACAAARHAFNVLTVLLAVNYLDRCLFPSSGTGRLRLQRNKPWMGRLAAVACLSLAAKVEETSVPLLLDFQVAAAPEPEEENKYVFEAKSVRRMELLVLSALGWRVNSVTPLSFIHHLLPQLCHENFISTAATSATHIRDMVSRSEAALLSVIADWRWVRHPASAWAAAAVLYAVENGGGTAAAHHLVSHLDAPKEKVEECYKLIMESVDHYNGEGVVAHKRKRKHSSASSFSFNHCCSPTSPSGVIDSCFSSCESLSSSGDSWKMWSSSSLGDEGEGIVEDVVIAPVSV